MALKVSFTVQDEYPEGFDRSRQVSGFRAIVSNIRDIGTNYTFNVGLNESDIISRMYFSEYADWITENNHGILMREVNNGWYRGVKLFPVLKGVFRIPTRIGKLKPDGDASKVRAIILKHMEVD